MLPAAERDAILGALPAATFGRRFAGGVASMLSVREGKIVDAGVLLRDPPEVFLRPLPHDDEASVAAWLELFDRRRAQLAHDLSGPATGVLAAIETVLEYEPIPPSTRTILSDARIGLLRFTGLLADRSSLLGSGPNLVAGPLATLVGSIAEPLVRTIGQRFSIRVNGSEQESRIDASLVEGALAVMLWNAWRFRRGHSAYALVEAEIEKGLLLLSVTDDGRGIDPDTLPRAGELAFTTRHNGAGMGLFLLRRALVPHGGAMVLQGLSTGTRATVLLPTNRP